MINFYSEEEVMGCVNHPSVLNARKILYESVARTSVKNNIVYRIFHNKKKHSSESIHTQAMLAHSLSNSFNWWLTDTYLTETMHHGTSHAPRIVILTSRLTPTQEWRTVASAFRDSGTLPGGVRSVLVEDADLCVIMDYREDFTIAKEIGRYYNCRYRVAYNMMTGQFVAKIPDLFCAVNGFRYTSWVHDPQNRTFGFRI